MENPGVAEESRRKRRVVVTGFERSDSETDSRECIPVMEAQSRFDPSSLGICAMTIVRRKT